MNAPLPVGPLRRFLPALPVLVGVGVFVAFACGKPTTPPPPPTYWSPGTVARLERTPNARGLTELRGLVHAHSIYSHDACDGQPITDAGTYDQSCLDDFRRDLCHVGHDFVFLTDHNTSFSANEYPDVLLHRPAAGDVLVSHGDGPTANWLTCPDGRNPLIMAGTESATMPVGLERHAADAGQRRDVYDDQGNATLDRYHDLGGLTLVPHIEGWTPEQLTSMHLDGFEMFNLHRNALKNAGVVADLLFNYVEKGDFSTLPHPDLFLTAFSMDDDVYLATWGTTLARGAKRVTTMGSDCHRNSFPQLLQDGERIDSYRRMMGAFSNHLLVQAKADGGWDDRDLKAALKAGRNFGVFEFLGYAQGFDVEVLEGGVAHELGDTVSAAKGVVLRVTMPTVANLDPANDAPTLTMKVWRAKEGGWDEVTSTQASTLEQTLTQPGAYRVEVRMVPKHLKPWIGLRSTYLKTERPWVYTSAFYVEP